MAHLIPKLNLNKTPQTVEDGSMIFAKNIRLLKDGNIGRDYGQKKVNGNVMSALTLEFRYLIKYGGLSNSEIIVINRYNAMLNTRGVQCKLISVIPYNHVFYALYRIVTTASHFDIIVKHKEDNSIEVVRSAWKYNGGAITGNVQVNLNDDIILTICESFDDIENRPLIPVKTLNLTYSRFDDKESIYTQAPNIPIVNLSLKGYYTKIIPNGVYQFFIRYKIREGYYTQWMPCSTELYTGNTKLLSTQQGSIQYTDVHEDSNKSFILNVDRAVDYKNSFIKYQIGFILSHDDETYARAWKHFDIDNSVIYFDYNKNDITEIDITELLTPIYQLYNVKNITNFKNKQYVSNYIETDFSPKISKEILDGITVDIKLDSKTSSKVQYDGYNTNFVERGGKYYIKEIEGKPVNEIIAELYTNIEKTGYPYWYHGYDWEQLPDKNPEVNEEQYGIKFRTYCVGPCRREDYKAVHAQNHEGTPSGLRLKFDTDDNIWEFTFKGDFDYTEGGHTLALYDDVYDRVYSLVKYIHNGELYDANFKKIYINDGMWYMNGPSIPYPDQPEASYPTSYLCRIGISLNIKNEKIVQVSDESVFNTTLLPCKTYNFYIHFVKQTGEITNGYLVDTIDLKTKEVISDDGTKYSGVKLLKECLTNHKTIYPVFKIHAVPKQYVAYFFSIADIKTNIVEINNHTREGGDVYSQALEVTVGLKPYMNNIPVRQPDTTDDTKLNEHIGTYHSSSDPTLILTYGSVGVISAQPNLKPQANAIIIDDTNRENTVFDLIKCTPYISNYNQEDKIYDVGNENLNLLGFIVNTNPLPITFDEFFSGTDAYKKDISTGSISLTEIDMPKIKPYSRNASSYIYSEYNLNYLGLTEDYIVKIKGSGQEATKEKILVIVKDSQLLSEVYTLPKMYYEFTRKTYNAYDENNVLKINFSNTIRSSQLSSDESIINNYYFPPTDYYNMPTTKGIITNLVAVGNGILVHTEDSLFKFNGNNSISASGGEDIQLNESEVFDTGISEIFGSQYGFGGLKYKTDSIVLEQGYIFYDTDSRIIYMYSGEGQNKPISTNIDKLLKSKKVEHIYFANDFYNDRVFMLIKEQTNTLVLTYNLVLKDFISIHDITYDKSFNTKTKCYFIKGDSIYTIDETSLEYNVELINYTSHYPKHTSDTLTNKKPSSIIDVMFNASYELVKTLNSISWICGKITDFNNDEDVNLAEELLDYSYKGDYVQIYTDSCATDQIPLRGRSNDTSINVTNPDTEYAKFDADSYLKPYFEKGRWNLNYFRDIKNITKTLNIGRETYISDDNSLIYGKYIVCRFIFESGNNFKFENLFVNTETL